MFPIALRSSFPPTVDFLSVRKPKEGVEGWGDFSKHWKNLQASVQICGQLFQPLEKSAGFCVNLRINFPNIGNSLRSFADLAA